MWQEIYPLLERGHHQELVTRCHAALGFEPENSQLQMLLAAGLEATGQDQDALPVMEKLSRAHPNNDDIRQRFAALLYRLGKEALRQGDLPLAIERLERATVASPRDEAVANDLVGLYVPLVQTHEAAGQWDQAARLMGAVCRINPHEFYQRYQCRLSGLDAAQRGKTEEAIHLFQQAIAPSHLRMSYDIIRIMLQRILPLDETAFTSSLLLYGTFTKPDDVENCYFVAHMLLVRDQPLAEAAALCQRLEDLVGPKEALAVASGAAQDILGNRELARVHYESLFAKTPDHPLALQGIAALEQIAPPKQDDRPLTQTHYFPKRPLSIVVYSNCQGRPVCHLLEKALSPHYECQIKFIRNYEIAHAFEYLSVQNFVKTADIVFYQPQRKLIDGRLFYDVPEIIKKDLPVACIKISFPYVFNSAIWPIVHDVDHLISSNFLVDLIKDGCDADRVDALYRAGDLDFDFAGRWGSTMQILADRERFTDVKLAGFIGDNIHRDCLFFGHRHPRHPVYVECARQCLDLLSKNNISCDPSDVDMLANQASFIEFSRRLFSCEYFPVDRYSNSYFKFDWLQTGGEQTAERYYRQLLRWAANGTMPIVPGSRSDI